MRDSSNLFPLRCLSWPQYNMYMYVTEAEHCLLKHVKCTMHVESKTNSKVMNVNSFEILCCFVKKEFYIYQGIIFSTFLPSCTVQIRARHFF
jgi:hypothetical protein